MGEAEVDRTIIRKRHDLPKGKWRRVVDPDEDAEAPFVIITDHYIIGIKTGRVIFLDKATGKKLDPMKGFHNLFSGDVKADESEMVVLEQRNLFSVISLKNFEVKMKVTLPRTFLATDVYCTYSEDDTKLIVPISKYDNSKKRYVYYRCEYVLVTAMILSTCLGCSKTDADRNASA